MGIRFLCKNCGRRLNVKSIQAGQEGLCPHCRLPVLVPQESTIEAISKVVVEGEGDTRFRVPNESVADSDDLSAFLDDEQVTIDGEVAGQQQKPVPAVQNVEPKPSQPLTEAELFLLGRPSPPTNLGDNDPIRDAPKRIWYFRSRSLGERGPLKSKAMQQQLDAGHVGVGTMVWRDDWDDWLPAETVFPDLAADAKKQRQQDQLNRAIQNNTYQLPEELDPESNVFQRKRRRIQQFRIAIGVGLIVIIGLVLLLLQLVAE